ncbi:MAG TPA: DUF4397 domain-containing protein [Mucilaginibacter sp.]|nr:DUF4397 domain-containing protein [Mucilaginibacter sp.]
MNTNRKNLKKWTAGIGAICMLSFFSSCLKDNNANYTPPPTALVSFVQASPDEQPIDLYFNANKVNRMPLVYGNELDYFRAYVGNRIVNIYTENSTGNKLVSDTITLKQDSVYSLFMVNTSASPQILLVHDSLSNPGTGNAGIRFINVSPDASSVDLAVHGGSVLVSDKAFKGYSSFIKVPTNKSYTFDVRQAGTNTVLATLSDITPTSGFMYTIWFHGLAGGTNSLDKLGVDIITNAYY